MAEAFFTAAKGETVVKKAVMKVRWKEPREKYKYRERKERGENPAANTSKCRLSFLVCKHVRYVLEEDTKDDSWSSSFGPEHNSGPASYSVSQSVPAAATIAPEVSKAASWMLHGACAKSRMHAWAIRHRLPHCIQNLQRKMVSYNFGFKGVFLDGGSFGWRQTLGKGIQLKVGPFSQTMWTSIVL